MPLASRLSLLADSISPCFDERVFVLAGPDVIKVDQVDVVKRHGPFSDGRAGIYRQSIVALEEILRVLCETPVDEPFPKFRLGAALDEREPADLVAGALLGEGHDNRVSLVDALGEDVVRERDSDCDFAQAGLRNAAGAGVGVIIVAQVV